MDRAAMRRIFWALTVVLALTGVARAESWMVVSEDNFPPYNYNDRDGRIGLDVEIVDAVLRHIGVTPEHKGLPWKRVVNDLDTDQTDIAFQFVGRPDRFESYAMVGPFRTGMTVFMVRADSAITFDRLEDLRGRRVGVVQGFTYTPEFDAAGFIDKEAAIDNVLNIRKLVGGRIDAVIGDHYTLQHIARVEGVAGKLRMLPKPLSVVPRYIAFPKSRKDKADRFAKGLEDLKADGTIDAILSRWTMS